MGQKINPTGFRLPVTRDWTSRWYAEGRNFARTLGEDLKVRSFLQKKLRNASVSRILIERPAKNSHHDLLRSSGCGDRQARPRHRSFEERSSKDDGRACSRQHRRSASS